MRGSIGNVASLYCLNYPLSIMGELFSGHHLKFKLPVIVKYKRMRKRRLYHYKKMRRRSASKNRRLKKLLCWRKGNV